MAVKWGSTVCTVIKWGNTVCTEVYWGSTLVFPIGSYNGSSFSGALAGGFKLRSIYSSTSYYSTPREGTVISSGSLTFSFYRYSSSSIGSATTMWESVSTIDWNSITKIKMTFTVSLSGTFNACRVTAVGAAPASSDTSVPFETITSTSRSFLSSNNSIWYYYYDYTSVSTATENYSGQEFIWTTKPTATNSSYTKLWIGFSYLYKTGNNSSGTANLTISNIQLY